MTRKEFLASLGALAGGALLASCGGDDGGTADAATVGNCQQNGTSVNILGNHGHVLVVSMADVSAGVDKTYDIMGTAAHTHSVTITVAQFAMLATNHSITTNSSITSSHSHGILVMCA